MITILIVTLLVLLTVAVVILFAMLGELSAQVSAAPVTGEGRPESIQPLPDAKLGAKVIELPKGLARPPGVLLVLSTTCGACQELAPQARGFFASAGVELVGIVVSCASAESGRDFVTQFGLADVPSYVDVSGQFSTAALGVGMSPAAVALSAEGIIRSAVVFSSFNALSSWIGSLDEVPAPADGASIMPSRDPVR
ncbi:hypothetical protein [Nonomuraea sp. NPDC048916]|uniref:TlpA family protein disulfide reductase n=1 Tax=Nonomuraea sp. NPDC048916 TaxID=3154232 RepID=UPI0033EACE41